MDPLHLPTPAFRGLLESAEMKKGVFAVALLSLLAFGGYAWFASNLDTDATFSIGESAYLGLATKMGMSKSDFVAPQPLDKASDSRMVVLTWLSKSKPGCRIEVDIDRRYSNARPIWQCS